MKFATVRLGKTSVKDIRFLAGMPQGIVPANTSVDVVCTQVPEELDVGTVVFVWLGSDNSKGAPTDWKQGFKVVGVVGNVNRGAKYNDESTTTLSLKYAFTDSIAKVDILRECPDAYYWCSTFPVIGLDDHSNQTIRCISEDADRSEIGAFLYALEAVQQGFRATIVSVMPEIDSYFWNSLKAAKSEVLSTAKSIPTQNAFPRPDILAAIRTKPFILLAGISGTGKSRLVRQLARGCCPEWQDEAKSRRHPLHDERRPGNFEMIQVRPNWHDSTQLLGYESRVSGKPEFVVRPFVKFLAKAWLYAEEGVPFFLCLDEMNLAPVEQYFAEFLSVVETRRTLGGRIVTDPLVTFPNEALLREAFKDIYQGVEHDRAERFVRQFIDEGGIAIPPNFVVMGTVNMDETTFSFSRKVLDRAMSFELNEVDMDGGLAGPTDTAFGSIPAEAATPRFLKPCDFHAAHGDVCGKVVEYLKAVNAVLENTPFKFAYRTRDEVMLYCVERTKDGMSLAQALDEATAMKILSRVEGDRRRLVVRDDRLPEYNGKPLLDSLLDAILKGLKAVRGGDGDYAESDVCSRKLKEMMAQLENGYTSFWTR